MIVRGAFNLMEQGRACFYCPACKEDHLVKISGDHSWGFNENYEKPTLTPSVKVTGTQRLTEEEYQQVKAGNKITTRPMICHSFITDGRIQFLNDCTHSLAGQTVDLPQYPSEDER